VFYQLSRARCYIICTALLAVVCWRRLINLINFSREHYYLLLVYSIGLHRLPIMEGPAQDHSLVRPRGSCLGPSSHNLGPSSIYYRLGPHTKCFSPYLFVVHIKFDMEMLIKGIDFFLRYYYRKKHQ
jgi:hypothetical protein